jgi:hypothetical protein
VKVSWFDIIRCILTVLAPVTIPQLLIGVCGVVYFAFADLSQKYQMGERELATYYLIFTLVLNAPLIAVWSIHLAKSKKESSDN